MFVLATKPQTLGEVFKDTMKLCKHAFVRCMPLALLMSLLLQLLSAFSVHPGPHAKVFSWVNIFLMPVSMAITAFLFPALLHFARALIINEDAPLKTSLSLARSKFITTFFAMFLISVLTLIGLVFLIIPGLFLLIAWLFYMPAIVFDDATIFSSMRNSFRLVRGSWWQTFFLFSLAISAGLFLMSIFTGILISMSGLALGIFRFILSAFLSFLLSILLIVQFNNLKLRLPIREEEKRRLASAKQTENPA